MKLRGRENGEGGRQRGEVVVWSGDGNGGDDVMEERAHEVDNATHLPLWSEVIWLKLGRSELYNLTLRLGRGGGKAEGRSAVRRGTWDESAATKVIDKKYDASGRHNIYMGTTYYVEQERTYHHQ
jgi:hypothetical protein